MAGKTVIIFDFDRTLIEDDSDRWVLTKMGLTELFNQLRSTLPWNSLMDNLLEELYIQGKTVDDIAECLKGIPLHLDVIAVIKSAYALGCDLKVVSDSNLFYIKTVLEHYGIYNCFSEIISNSVVVDNGRLRIFPYHDTAASHGCALCPPNLCKGCVIKQIQASISESESKRLIYIGDGMNDFCPTLKLAADDCVMPRKNFPFRGRILKNPQLVKAKVYEWKDSEDLARILLNLINGKFN
ncbi:putative haloacid dehalogenase-like hydrolase [Handroanthus impetiginosus]|uniref:Putative haloacid dehalogenase-like hydrolase n=1 Tax=Handroanthus impetiginosus TaxID=429701 RepID=A0A2G9GB74_9LAMI|nr:putative haloacid dehalogenase-like hydrolase [Handroanthus impetiginosus]